MAPGGRRVEKRWSWRRSRCAVVLVTAAGLLSASLSNLQSFDAGFSRDRVMLADIDLAGARLSPENRLRLFADLLERMRSVRGVESVSLVVAHADRFQLAAQANRGAGVRGDSTQWRVVEYRHARLLSDLRPECDPRPRLHRRRSARHHSRRRHQRIDGAPLLRQRRSDRTDVRAGPEHGNDVHRGRRRGRAARGTAIGHAFENGLSASVAEPRRARTAQRRAATG